MAPICRHPSTAPGSSTSKTRAASFRRTPSASELHLTSRVTYGWTPALGASVERAGGLAAWFTRQLDPAAIADDQADTAAAWWPRLGQDVDRLWDTPGGYFGALSVGLMDDFQNEVLARRIISNRQVLETMTELWEHSLHVPVDYTQTTSLFRADYHRTVRAHALGRFADLLTATVTHPAMGLYLGNAVSTRSAPNENLGRELLELHTLGLGNYT